MHDRCSLRGNPCVGSAGSDLGQRARKVGSNGDSPRFDSVFAVQVVVVTVAKIAVLQIANVSRSCPQPQSPAGESDLVVFESGKGTIVSSSALAVPSACLWVFSAWKGRGHRATRPRRTATRPSGAFVSRGAAGRLLPAHLPARGGFRSGRGAALRHHPLPNVPRWRPRCAEYGPGQHLAAASIPAAPNSRRTHLRSCGCLLVPPGKLC